MKASIALKRGLQGVTERLVALNEQSVKLGLKGYLPRFTGEL
jgi:hypothetical protein